MEASFNTETICLTDASKISLCFGFCLLQALFFGRLITFVLLFNAGVTELTAAMYAVFKYTHM